MLRRKWKDSLGLTLLVLFLGFAVFGFGGCGGGGGETVPVEEYALSDLQGRWNVESGSGRASGPDGTYTLSLESGYLDGTLLEETASSARVQVNYSILCRAVNLSGQSASVRINNEGEATVSKVGINCYRYAFPEGSLLTITLLSKIQAKVEEQGNFTINGYTYSYAATYTFRKTIF